VERGVMGGAPLHVCPRCSSLYCGAYCGECGEKLEWQGDCWGALRLDVAARSGLARQEAWRKFPGEWESASGGVRLMLEGPEHLAWVRERMAKGGLERYVSLEGPSGRRILSDEAVFKCAIKYMDSQIRCCMTQRFRTPVCGEESTLLPLWEPRRTSSLADILEEGGDHLGATSLVAGVLWERSVSRQRIYCPLFGRALRFSRRDAEELPARMADVLESRRRQPRSFLLPAQIPSRSHGVVAGEEKDELLVEHRFMLPGLTMPAVVQMISPSLVWVGYEGENSRGGLLRCSGELQPLAEVGRTHVSQGVVVLQYPNPQGLWVTALATGSEESLSQAVHLSPGVCDVDVRGDRAAALFCTRGRVGVVWLERHSEAASVRRRVSGYGVGAIPSTGWRIAIVGQGAVVCWNLSGACMLLTDAGGWMLSPTMNLCARLGSVAPLDFVGVKGVVPGRPGEFYLLSSLGHRLTLLTLETSVGGAGAPVRVLMDRAYPLSFRRFSGGGGSGAIYAQDLVGCCRLDPRSLVPELVGGGANGRVMVVEGGAYALRDDGELRVMSERPLAQGLWAIPLLGETLQKLPSCGEVKSVVDRAGNLPHKGTWGS